MTDLFFTRLIRRAYAILGPLSRRETVWLSLYADRLALRYARLWRIAQ